MLADSWPNRDVRHGMRAIERASTVDDVRRRARKLVIAAMQEAGLWRGTIIGPRRFRAGRRAVEVCRALVVMAPDQDARLLLANAYMAAKWQQLAAREFARLASDGNTRRFRHYATLGLAIASSLDGERELGLEMCREAICSPFADIAQGGALSLVVQAARAYRIDELRFALDATTEMLGSDAVQVVARLLSNYATGVDAGRSSEIVNALAASGSTGEAVRLELQPLLRPC